MAKITHLHFKRRIRELIELNYSAPDIQKILEDETPEHLFHQIPSLRTIQRYVKQYGSQPGEEWRITDCDNPEDAQIIFEALRLYRKSPEVKKAPSITKELADMVIRIRKAVPTLDITLVVPIASLYLQAEAIDDIHLLLTHKPFENTYFYQVYVKRLKALYGVNWKQHAFYKLTRFVYEDGKVEIVPMWDFVLINEFSHEVIEEDWQPPAQN